MKILKRLTIPIIAGILGISAFLMPAINIEYNTDTGLHVGTAFTANAGSDKVKAVSMKDTLSYAVLEKSGCQIGKDGLIYLRYDLYLLPEAVGFNEWYITAAEQEAQATKDGTYKKGTIYKDINTPYLCVFVTVPSTITADEVKILGNNIVNKSYAGWASTYNVMTSVSELRPVLKEAKAVSTVTDSRKSALVKYDILVDLTNDVTIAEINPSEADTKSLSIVVGSKEIPIYAGDPIDVGPGATDRSAQYYMASITRIDLANPANDTGVLDTVEIWAQANLSGTKVGTFSGSGTSYDDRDYASIGNVTSGAKRTFTGQSIDVTSGDYLGVCASDGYIEAATSGGSGVYYYSGDTFGSGSHTYDLLTSRVISLYATGATVGSAPTITNSTGESNVTATGARLNYNLTDNGGENPTVTVYWGDNDGGTTAGSWDNNHSLGTQGTGTGYYDVSSLSTGTTYYYRYYASNSYGNDWADATESFLTKPAAPTNVSATDGTYTDKVVITWTKSTGATGYKIYEGANLLDTLGDVATYDDTAASAGTITAGSSVASDGTQIAYVALSLSGTSTSNGASRTYKVVATNATGDSADSSTDTGYRGVGSLTYQWQRSAADSDASYSNIDGATTATYNDTAAPENGDGRYYKCLLTATGASNQTSAADRGYRALAPTAPTITNSTGASNIESTTARLNGNLTDNGNVDATVWVYWGNDDAGTTAINWDYSHSLGILTEGTCYYDVSSLPTGTTIYYRYYATNSEGSDWADSTASFLTKPAAPTGVSATDGTHTDKVVITWSKSTGATGYKVYQDGNLVDTLGDVATYDDTTADAAIITAGTAVASDGTSGMYVSLSITGESIANGTTHAYTVIALNATGDSVASSADNGYRGHGVLTYQWQVSAADSDADYSNIDGATTESYNYTAAPANPDARYYKCILSATGASNQTTTADRGYKAAFAAPTVTTVDCIGFGDTWAILKGYISDTGDAGTTEVGIEYGLTDAYGTTETLTGTWTTGDYFVVFVDNLTKGTVYYYRAYANNTATGYGGNEYFNTTGSPVIYEYMNTNGDGDSAHIYANNWGSEYFLVGSESHTVSKVILKLKRTGSPGTVTVSLRHATAGGLPTGIDLVSTTKDGDVFSTNYTWYEFEFDSEYTLEGNSGYCIVVRAVAGDTDNDVQWQKDTGGDGDTTNDFASDSTDGGLTWTADAGNADYLFEVWGNPCIDVISAKVYTNYIDEGDMLFLILYENIYEPYYPYDDPSLYFEFQLLDTDGLTILANTPCMQYDYMPAAIYISADSASNLNWGSNYYVNLYGKFGDNPVAQYQIQAEDWLGNGLLYLKQWCINTANDMEEWYYEYLGESHLLVTQNSSNVYVLNQAGGTAFATGIPYLTTVFSPTNPAIVKHKNLVLFENLDLIYDHYNIDVNDVYSNYVEWEDMVGTDVENISDSISDIFGGIGSKTVVAVLILFAYLIVAGIVVGKNTDNVTLALALAFPFLGFAAYIRVIDMAYIAITAAVALILMVWSYYFTRM